MRWIFFPAAAGLCWFVVATMEERTLKALAWIFYGILGLVVTYFAVLAGQPWFALAVALCFIFGPKVWKSF